MPSRLAVARAGTEAEPPALVYAEHAGCRPREEPRPRQPGPDAVWVDGSCRYDGTRFVWTSGYYRTFDRKGARP